MEVIINENRVSEVLQILNDSDVPSEKESSTHNIDEIKDKATLANCYLAIVAICHQTSPIGERQLEGTIKNFHKRGWDYLKERFLHQAWLTPEISSFKSWSTMTPIQLSTLFEDSEFGKTLNRITERSFLLNDLGNGLLEDGFAFATEPFSAFGSDVDRFLDYLSKFAAYSDPVRKKGLFFLSLAVKECGWQTTQLESLPSPIDYHELRGHLRIGTVQISDRRLVQKLALGITLEESEDTIIRTKIQEVNNILSQQSGLSSSVIHYLVWNIFRNCCPRPSAETHCLNCSTNCSLPVQYKSMKTYEGRCIFSPVCQSANLSNKVIEPPYAGHFY